MNPKRIAGWVTLGAIVFVAVLSLVWTPYDPLQAMPADRLAAPSATHLLGTDELGRDLLSRIMMGARYTVAASAGAAALSLLVGVPLGILAGMRRSWTERTIMGGSDVLMAFPALLLAIALTAAFGASMWIVVLALGIAGIPGFVRVSRVATLRVMSQDYILAARLNKVPGIMVAWRHVLPNILPVVITQIAVAFSMAVLAESGLSFLGFGVQAPYASWGRMLQASQPYLATAPHLALWPALAIALTILACNVAGGPRDRRF